MLYRILADLVVVFHLFFAAFVVLGGLFLLRWQGVIWLHLPTVFWGVFIQFVGWPCPLTPLENHLRRLGGGTGYSGGFVENYLLGFLYPEGLTREMKLALGVLVIVLNVLVYTMVLRRSHGTRETLSEHHPEGSDG